jgi:RNA polymerase sigma-70 factor (ECF subfamily)
MHEPDLEESKPMNIATISQNSVGVGYVGRPKAAGGCDPSALVTAFGARIFSIARHITQNDEHAGDVLIEAFLEVCPDLDGCEVAGTVWLRLVAVAVREAFLKLRDRGEHRPFRDQAVDPSEDLVIRELDVWGDNFQQLDSHEGTTRLLERGLRSLDPMGRTVFVLRDIEEIPVEHIAAIVNRSAAAVEVCLFRARLRLGEMLAHQMKRQ